MSLSCCWVQTTNRLIQELIGNGFLIDMKTIRLFVLYFFSVIVDVGHWASPSSTITRYKSRAHRHLWLANSCIFLTFYVTFSLVGAPPISFSKVAWSPKKKLISLWKLIRTFFRSTCITYITVLRDESHHCSSKSENIMITFWEHFDGRYTHNYTSMATFNIYFEQ